MDAGLIAAAVSAGIVDLAAALPLARFGFIAGIASSSTSLERLGLEGTVISGAAAAIFRTRLTGRFFGATRIWPSALSAGAFRAEVVRGARGLAVAVFFGFFIATVLSTGVARSLVEIKRVISVAQLRTH